MDTFEINSTLIYRGRELVSLLLTGAVTTGNGTIYVPVKHRANGYNNNSRPVFGHTKVSRAVTTSGVDKDVLGV